MPVILTKTTFMSLFSGALQTLFNSGPTGSGLSTAFGIRLTEGSKKININTSLTISAFYCAVNTIANSLAMLPMHINKQDDKNSFHFTDHPAYYLLYRQPNELMSAFTFKFIMVSAVLLRGNAYAYIQRNNRGEITSFHYMDPDLVSPILYQGKLYYQFMGEMLTSDEVLHIPGFSFDGICGKSVIAYAADNLGISLSAQNFASESYQDRGLGYGVLETDKSVKVDKKIEIEQALERKLSSGGKFKNPLLDEGFKYKQITLKPEEARFIEAMSSGTEDIARWFNIPRHKLHISGEGGHNFIVEMQIEYLQDTIMPLGEKFKQEFERKLFTSDEVIGGVTVNLNYKKLLQADPKSRAEYYKSMVFVRAITPNEIRKLEDMNPVDGGDEFLQMANLLNEQQIKNTLKNE